MAFTRDSYISLDNHELARELELKNKQSLSLFKKIPTSQKGFVIILLPVKLQHKILKSLSNTEILKFLHYLDLEAASKVISCLDKERRTVISHELGEDIKEKLAALTNLDPERVENLMDLNYVEVDQETPVDTISRIVEQYEKKTGRFPTILVVEAGYLKGSIPGHALVVSKDKDSLLTYVKELPTVRYSDGPKKIVEAYKSSKHDKIVVLDDDDSILGIIYSDEVMSLIEKETAKKLYEFAGLNQKEDIEDNFKVKVKFRYKWLIINLFTAFLAAFVVSAFEDTISKMVLLAAYMPIVAGMGGNAATQTLAVVVRGLAVKDITKARLFKVVVNEMSAGFINGVINALIIAVIAYYMHNSLVLGFVAGAAVIFNLLIAGFFGTVIPVLMQKLGKDPASSATIFITTATDVLGFMAFLQLANFFL
jgi:magnesium transporter